MRKKVQAFSLIELLVASFISLILLSSLMQVYLTTKRNFELQITLSNMQDNARMLVYYLSRRIRMAGLAICESNTSSVNQTQAIQSLPKTIRRQVVKNTDAVTLAECIPYRKKSQFMKIIYYIGRAAYQDYKNETVYALYEKPMGGRRELLVPNVINMQVKYGVLNLAGKKIIQYLSADRIRNWQQVYLVRINFLLRSKYKMLQQKMRYQFSGKTYRAPDKHYYQAWEFYVALRERA